MSSLEYSEASIVNAALCSLCRKVVEHAAQIKPSPTPGNETLTLSELVFTSTELLEKTMSETCPLCRLFWSILTTAEKNEMRDLKFNQPSLSDTHELSVDHFEAAYEVYYGVHRSNIFEFEFHYSSSSIRYSTPTKNIEIVIIVSSNAVFQARDQPVLDSSTSSPTTIKQARQWLDACCTSHTECTSAGGFNPSFDDDEFFLPSRLVDVQSADTGYVRLCERDDIDRTSKYLTLSHCWGKKMPKRLLKAALNAMKQSILINELSQTFQDALVMTRRLRLRYIWIDSLCIIQDSEADWRKESALMGQVYSNSYCNLAASSATDGDGGLFHARDTFPLQQMKLEVGGRIYNIVPSELWSRGVEDMPLNTRAWVFQERILARRNLHFSSTQLYWECYHSTACESLPITIPIGVGGGRYQKRNPRVTGEASGAEYFYYNGNQEHSYYTLWADIVETYSKGALTYETDKLIALSGVAMKMQPILVDTYVAGLWRRHLPSELLWTTKIGCQGTRTAQYVAPSWSWASINHRVRNVSSFIYEDDRDSLVEILDVQVEPLADSNVFGQVKSGTIRLVGRIAQVCLEWSREDGDDILLLGKEAKYVGSVYVHPDNAFSQLCRENEGVWELYCVLLRQKLVFDPLNRCALEGLLLEYTGVFAEFRRFGTFHAWEQEDAMAILDACEWFAETADSNILGTVVDKQGSRRHTIEII